MIEHIKNIQNLYGDDVYVQIPNGIFKTLSQNTRSKNGSANTKQSSFAYAYVAIVSLLYKYTHFVDIDNSTYIQNSDIKELLGYSRTTKSIDHIIKKGGLLDNLGLTTTTKDYPVGFEYSSDSINGVAMRTFTTINDIKNDDSSYYELIKGIVKNRNYEIKEPTYFISQDDGNGTLYDYSDTHKVSLEEIITFIEDENLDNIDMYIYFFLKSKCEGYKDNTNSIKLLFIVSQTGMCKFAFYNHLQNLKDKGYVEVDHKGWTSGSTAKIEANSYKFNGIVKNLI